jgi:hypothetical protein
MSLVPLQTSCPGFKLRKIMIGQPTLSVSCLLNICYSLIFVETNHGHAVLTPYSPIAYLSLTYTPSLTHTHPTLTHNSPTLIHHSLILVETNHRPPWISSSIYRHVVLILYSYITHLYSPTLIHHSLILVETNHRPPWTSTFYLFDHTKILLTKYFPTTLFHIW